MDNTGPLARQVTATKTAATCCQQGTQRTFRSLLLTRRTLAIAAATVAVGAGMALNWGWLVAAGIAPLILSILPCLVMCALGACACKLLGGDAKAKAQADNGAPAAPQVIK